jgi:hypothetical protein
MKFEKSKLEPIFLEMGGTKYPVKVTFNAMADFEEYFSKSYQQVLDKLLAQDLNTKELQFVLYTLLKTGGVELTLEDLDDADFTLDTLSVMTDALMRANKVLSVITEIADGNKGGSDEENKKKTKKA